MLVPCFFLNSQLLCQQQIAMWYQCMSSSSSIQRKMIVISKLIKMFKHQRQLWILHKFTCTCCANIMLHKFCRRLHIAHAYMTICICPAISYIYVHIYKKNIAINETGLGWQAGNEFINLSTCIYIYTSNNSNSTRTGWYVQYFFWIHIKMQHNAVAQHSLKSIKNILNQWQVATASYTSHEGNIIDKFSSRLVGVCMQRTSEWLWKKKS